MYIFDELMQLLIHNLLRSDQDGVGLGLDRQICESELIRRTLRLRVF